MFARRGLSPYTRGNRSSASSGVAQNGSIPVHTGKPKSRSKQPEIIGVYPRTHGETPFTPFCQNDKTGLSPYTRGNHFRLRRRITEIGSIPVHTGKPQACLIWRHFVKVYPRTHGETCTNVYFIIPRKMDGESFDYLYSLFTNKTPSASRISLGGSPR